MFIVIYQFEVVEGMEEQFHSSWKILTELITKHEGGLGSRMHHEKDQIYLAYAQWHSKKQWENAGGNLPESANSYRSQMKAACVNISMIHELEVLEDLLI